MERRIEKPWGHEQILHADDRYVMKELHIKKGQRLSLQYHIWKTETLYLVKGKAKVYLCSPSMWAMGEEIRYDKGNGSEPIEFDVGSNITIQAGWIHRIEAIEDCVFVEASTVELWDVIHIEDDFGRVKE